MSPSAADRAPFRLTPRGARALFALVVISALVGFAWMLSPLIGDRAIQLVHQSPTYTEARISMERTAKNGIEIRRDISVPVTPLISVTLDLQAVPGAPPLPGEADAMPDAVDAGEKSEFLEGDATIDRDDKPTEVFFGEVPTVIISYERLVLFIGAMVILLASGYLLLFQSVSERDSSAPFDPEVAGEPLTVLCAAIDVSAQNSLTLLRRSTYLLVSGIAVSFVGIAVFFVAFPGGGLVAATGLPGEVTIGALRAFGMLVFVEAIAWFLLRQYRTLLDDQKWALRQQMRRTNVLAALALVDTNEDSRHALVQSLLNEDYRGILEPNQSTETLERGKAADGNDVFDFAKKVLEAAPGVSRAAP